MMEASRGPVGGHLLAQNGRGKRFGMLAGRPRYARPRPASTPKRFPRPFRAKRWPPRGPREASIILFILWIILYAFHPCRIAQLCI